MNATNLPDEAADNSESQGSACDQTNWTERAKHLLQRELAVRGIKYPELSARLREKGVIETPKALQVKVSRGTFQLAFFLVCMDAIGCKAVSLIVESATTVAPGEGGLDT